MKQLNTKMNKITTLSLSGCVLAFALIFAPHAYADVPSAVDNVEEIISEQTSETIDGQDVDETLEMIQERVQDGYSDAKDAGSEAVDGMNDTIDQAVEGETVDVDADMDPDSEGEKKEGFFSGLSNWFKGFGK